MSSSSKDSTPSIEALITRQKPDSTSTTVWADLYKRGCFILETKQGVHPKKDRNDLAARLVALNHERAAEEAQGKIRYLRPDYQDPNYQESGDRIQKSEQTELVGTDAKSLATSHSPLTTAAKQPWPKDLPAQVAALSSLLPETGPNPSTLAAHFGKRTKKRIEEIQQILTTLQNLGQL